MNPKEQRLQTGLDIPKTATIISQDTKLKGTKREITKTLTVKSAPFLASTALNPSKVGFFSARLITNSAEKHNNQQTVTTNFYT